MAIIRQYSSTKRTDNQSKIFYFPAKPSIDVSKLNENNEFTFVLTACVKDFSGLTLPHTSIKLSLVCVPSWLTIINQSAETDVKGFVSLKLKCRLGNLGTGGYAPVEFIVSNEITPRIIRSGVISFVDTPNF